MLVRAHSCVRVRARRVLANAVYVHELAYTAGVNVVLPQACVRARARMLVYAFANLRFARALVYERAAREVAAGRRRETPVRVACVPASHGGAEDLLLHSRFSGIEISFLALQYSGLSARSVVPSLAPADLRGATSSAAEIYTHLLKCWLARDGQTYGGISELHQRLRGEPRAFAWR